MNIYAREQIARAVSLDRTALQVIEQAFKQLGEGRVVQPPILSMVMPEANGEVDVKTAWIRGSERFAIKISPGFFDNPQRGLPSLSGLMVVLSAVTGQPQAILLDEGYLTAIRTALAGAVAAKYLARSDSRRVTVIGAGEQARLQLAALRLVFPIDRLDIWARDAQAASRFAGELEGSGITVYQHQDIGRACENADIIVTTTPATSPLLFAEHLPAGVHVTAMGSDNAEKQEIDRSALVKADFFACDLQSQSERNGELKTFRQQAEGVPFRVYELGQIIACGEPFPRGRESITLCCLTGTGVQDSAIADFALSQMDSPS